MKLSVWHWLRNKWRLLSAQPTIETLKRDKEEIEDLLLPGALTDKFQDVISLNEPNPSPDEQATNNISVESSMDPEPLPDIVARDSNIDLSTTHTYEPPVDSASTEVKISADSETIPFPENFQLAHKIHFFMEQLDELDFHFYIGGWIFSELSDITRLTVLISQDDKESFSDLYYGIDRHDVFNHYNIEKAQRCGFIDSVEKSFEGKVHISLIATCSDEYKFIIDLGEFQFRSAFLPAYNEIISANRHAFYTNNKLKRYSEKKIALYTKAAVNYFFNEIKTLLTQGLQSLGYEVLDLDESSGFDNDAWLHLIIAPHEFYGKGIPKNYYYKPSNRLILFNTEQLSSEWFRTRSSYFAQAIEIWDMNYNSWQRLNREIDFVHCVPVGYVENFKLLAEVPRLPNNYFTCFLDEKITQQSYLKSNFEDRPIDILFIGHTSWRRQQFFVDNASFFAKYNCCFHLTDLSYGAVKENIAGIDLTTVIGLAQRSKIVLNIHHGIHPYFEWHRMVQHGIWQKSLIVTEQCSETHLFVPGRDFVQASLKDIPAKIEYFLETENGRKEANKIIHSAFNVLSTDCDFTSSIQALLISLKAGQINTPELRSYPEASFIKSSTDEQTELVFEQKSDLPAEVSVVITLYNYADLVLETLDSLLQQTHKPFDLVIVEDCSTDQSLSVAQHWLHEHQGFFNCIQLIHNKENRGLGASRNIAFRHTVTPFVFVLDADNIIFPRALERLLSGLINTDAALAYSYLEHFGDLEKLGGLRPWNPGLLPYGNIIDAMVLMRKQTWEKAGGYAEDMPCSGLEDYELLINIAESGAWALRIPEILCRYRVHSSSMSSIGLYKSNDKIVEYLKEKYPGFSIPSHLKQLRQNEFVVEEYMM